MKTGTTYVQNLLEVNREALASQGWWAPDQRRVVRATRELLALTDDAGRGRRGLRGRPSATSPRWEKLLAEARERPEPHTVVSMEFLSFAERARARQVVASASGLDVHVVLTARDAVGALPSQWQSLTRNRSSLAWPEFAEAARLAGAGGRPGSRPGVKAFRRTQDLPRMVEAWGEAVPRERFSVVTVPGSDQPRDLLWTRLLGVLGVDPAATTPESPFSNPQLGYGSCELLRRVNGAGLAGLKAGDYRRVMRRLARGHLLPLRDRQTRPRPDRATAEAAVGLNARTLDAVGRWATLVGDPADLPVGLAADVELDPGTSPGLPPDDEVRLAAQTAWRGGAELCAEEGLALPADLPAEAPDDLDRAVTGLATMLGVAITRDPAYRAGR
ncbi:hypothetical protein [Nocardioides marinquilinus]